MQVVFGNDEKKSVIMSYGEEKKEEVVTENVTEDELRELRQKYFKKHQRRVPPAHLKNLNWLKSNT